MVGKVHWLTKAKAKANTSSAHDLEDTSLECLVNYNCVLYGLPHLTLQ